MRIYTADGEQHVFSITEIEQLTFDGVTSIEDGKQLTRLMESFRLIQNYPNPFNPSTTIEFELSEPGAADIIIYSVTGQEVRRFSHSEAGAGMHRQVWDGRDAQGLPAASGIYFYQLVHGGRSESKQLLLLR
jgi:hypothetical protein